MNNNENLSNHQLLEDYERDPFIYLLKLVQKIKMKMSIDTQQEFKMQ